MAGRKSRWPQSSPIQPESQEHSAVVVLQRPLSEQSSSVWHDATTEWGIIVAMRKDNKADCFMTTEMRLFEALESMTETCCYSLYLYML